MSARAVTACFTRASLATARVWEAKLPSRLDPFRAARTKKDQVEREHHVQGTTRVLLPCSSGPAGYSRPHEYVGARRVAIHLNTNSYHQGLHLPTVRSIPFYTTQYISVTAAQNVGNKGTCGSGPGSEIQRIRCSSLHAAVLRCGVIAEACLDSIERRTV